LKKITTKSELLSAVKMPTFAKSVNNMLPHSILQAAVLYGVYDTCKSIIFPENKHFSIDFGIGFVASSCAYAVSAPLQYSRAVYQQESLWRGLRLAIVKDGFTKMYGIKNYLPLFIGTRAGKFLFFIVLN